MVTRRSVLQSTAVVSAVGATGCLGSLSGQSIEEVDGYTTVAPQIYEVELDEYEYTALELTAQVPVTYTAAFNVDEGQMALLLLTRQQFWEYQDGNRFEGRWDLNGTPNTFVRVTARFEAGQTFMVVADNTGIVEHHEVDGPTAGRVETQVL